MKDNSIKSDVIKYLMAYKFIMLNGGKMGYKHLRMNLPFEK